MSGASDAAFLGVGRSITGRRWRSRGDDERLNALNKAVLAKIQTDGEAYPSQTVLNGHFAIRANIMHYATSRQHVERLAELVVEAGDALARVNQ